MITEGRGVLRWRKTTPRDLEDRGDLAVVFAGLEMTLLFSRKYGQLYKTQGGYWYTAEVDEEEK